MRNKKCVSNVKRQLIILDTDMDSDCDDAGALAVLHNLEENGEVEILAIICDSPTQWGAPCIEYINNFFNRPNIPVGTIQIADYDYSTRYDDYKNHIKSMKKEMFYNKILGTKLLVNKEKANAYPCAVELYRKTLAAQPDKSVTICTIGLLSVLEKLLKSGPDKISPLDGKSLVEKKVDKLVTMAEIKFPEGGNESFNWRMDREAACYVLNNWPTPVAVSSYGRNVLTGKKLYEETQVNNPIRLAFLAFFEGEKRMRSSWDQIAVLYAVRGAANIYFEEKGYSISGDAVSGLFSWKKSLEGRNDMFIRPAVSNAILEDIIDSLMV